MKLICNRIYYEKEINIISVVGFVLFFSFSCTETSKNKNIVHAINAYNKNKQKLSSDKLKKATTIVYYCGNGTVAPDYHYDCYITVSKNNVNVTITQGYDGTVRYNKNHAISISEYQKFLTNLLKQGISKKQSDSPMLLGSGTSSITAKIKKQVIFEGDEYVDLTIAKGELQDSFLSLLPKHMKQVVQNPEGVLK